MATVQVLEEGQRNLVLNVITAADTNFLLVDVSALAFPCTSVRLDRVTYDVPAAGLATLLWDATVDVPFLTCSEGNGQTECYKKVGGIWNNAGAGKTGDVLLTATTGIHMVLHFVKKYN